MWMVKLLIAVNVALVIMYGVLHQGGLLAASRIVANDVLTEAEGHDTVICVAYVHTYMPPRTPLLLAAPFESMRDSMRIKTYNADADPLSIHESLSHFFEDDSRQCDLRYVVATVHSHELLQQQDPSRGLKWTRLVGSAPHFSGEEPANINVLFRNLQVFAVAS